MNAPTGHGTCDGCIFWNDHGRCHRNAPRPSTPNELEDADWNVDSTVWPVTDAHDWCGEYKPLPPKPEPPERASLVRAREQLQSLLSVRNGTMDADTRAAIVHAEDALYRLLIRI